MESFFHDSDQQVSGDSNPHLSLDCVLRSTKENFDTKMLLDPFEEQLDLPTASIKLGDSDCRQREVVGQEHQPFSGFGIFESDAAQWCVEILARVEASQHDGLIADQSGVPIDGMRIAAPGFEIGLGSRHKEAACLVKTVEPAKVDVGTVHDVEGSWFGQQQVQNIHVVSLPSLIWMNEGILPRRSKSLCSLIAAFAERNGAQGNTDRHKSMVLASKA